MSCSRYFHAIVSLLVAILIGGCATDPTVTHHRIGASAELVAPQNVTPANVGIYYVPAFANYVHTQALSDSVAVMNVGQESVRLFNLAIPQVFESTEPVYDMPPYDVAGVELDGIIEPRIDYVSWRMGFDSAEEFFHVGYTFIFYTSEGVPIANWKLVGEGKYLKHQLNDAAQKFVDGFSTAPETLRFREYLENRQLAEPGFDAEDIDIQATVVDENELGLNLKAAGILPVRLTVKNGSDQAVMGRGYDVRLIHPDGQRVAPAFPLSIVSAFEYLVAMGTDSSADEAAMAHFFLGSVGGIAVLTGGMLGTHSERLEVRKKEAEFFENARLKEVTLTSGGSVEGMLYFVLPQDVAELDEATLSLWLLDPSSGNGVRKEVPVPGIGYRINDLAKTVYAKTTARYAPVTARPVKFTGDFSGKYVSSITFESTTPGSNNRYFGGSAPLVTIVQDGNTITGKISNPEVTIWGDIEGNEIKFDYAKGSGGTGVGKWRFTPGSSQIVGSWVSSGRHNYGKWNLTKIE